MLDGLPSLEIPAIRTLALYKQWVLWRAEPLKDKLTKIPYRANHAKAATNRPAEWSKFDDVYAAAIKHEGLGYSGVGFVFSDKVGTRIMGIDLDHCRDSETGEIDPQMQEIVDRLDSYTEVSPSGTGVHILCRAVLAPDARHRVKLKNGMGIEIYATERFFTVTGEHLRGAPDEIKDSQEAVDWLAAKIQAIADQGRAPVVHANGHAHMNGVAPEAPRPSDDGLLELLEPHCTTEANCDPNMLRALKANSERFATTWDRSRKEVEGWSDSEFDMALASFMTAAEWSPVEVMRGLIQFRRQNSSHLKMNRSPKCDYYLRTIRAARLSRRQDDAQDVIRAAVNGAKYNSEEIDRDSVLDALGVVLNCQIKDVQRYSGDAADYLIHTAKGEIRGKIDMLMSQPKFRAAWADATQDFPGVVRAKDHDNRIRAMLSIAQLIDTGPDASATELVRNWLGEWLAGVEMQRDGGVIIASLTTPFMRNGRFYVSAPGFSKWLRDRHGQQFTVQKVAFELRKLRCTNKQVDVEVNGRPMAKRFWEINPATILG